MSDAPLAADPVPVNHDEAWSLACYKREHSNMARCYIEAIDTLRSLGWEITLRGDLKRPAADVSGEPK